jgi:hypothetical protein
VCGNEWFNVGSPMGTAGRRRTQYYALKDAKQAIRHLKILLVAGDMECNQDVIRKSPPLVVHGSLRSISGGVGIVHRVAAPLFPAAALGVGAALGSPVMGRAAP